MPFLAPAIAAISAFLAPAITFATSNFVGRLLVSVAASALMQALAPKPKKQGSGISTTVTQTGGLNACSFILGTYATAGTMMCPPMSHGTAGGSPLAYLTYVIELGDIAGQTLNKVIINDEYVTLGAPVDANYGQSVLGRYLGYAWVKYYDGSQTAADPGLLAKYGSYPTRPWSADMIGRGLCYAVLTFRINPELWQGQLRVRFEMGGIPLYDIRKDSTAGGVGTHRFATPSTWEQTNNPWVMIYNILRGITLLDGSVWGGRVAAADLTTASFMAAMNECDVASPATGGGSEAQFRAGYEVTLDQEPADVLAELLKASSGQLVEVGGRWKGRAGGPGLPVYFFTDADVIVSQAQDLKPFPGLEGSFNAIHASYPEPVSLWESKDAPPRYNATYEAEDQGRRRIADLTLPAVPYAAQVQRLMVAYIKEERRFRRHGLTLPPDAAILEPLDPVSWTSTINGYTAKIFEMSEVSDNLRTCLQRVSMRERDSADYSYPVDILLPSAPGVPGPVLPTSQSVSGWNVAGVILSDAGAVARRPALLLTWSGTNQDDVRAIRFEVRVTATAELVYHGSTHDVNVGQMIISAGILPNVSYEGRARYVVDRTTAWTAWDAATAPNIGITNSDYVGGIGSFLNGNNASWGEVVASLPVTGNWFGRQVILAGDGKNYIWNGTAWVTGVAAADIIGTLTTANFAASLRPPEIVAALPATANYLGRMVFLTTDQKLYKHKGSPTGSAGFSKDVDGADLLASSVIAGKIAAAAVGTAELAAGAATIEKLTLRDFINRVEDPGAELNGIGWALTGVPGDWAIGSGSVKYGTKAFQRSYAGAALNGSLANRLVFDTAPGKVYRGKYWARVDATYAGGAGGVRVRWLDATGAFLSTSNINGTLPTTTYVLYAGDVTAPANAVSGRVELYNFLQTAGSFLVDEIFLAEKNAGELVVDGFLAVMGMAAFAGDLQSTGYNPGVAGWKIKSDGTAEFADLVARSWVKDGAISDTFQTIAAGPFVGVAGSTLVASLDLGILPRGNIYKRGVVFEARRVTYLSQPVVPIVQLQKRTKQLGGGFTGWVTIETWDLSATTINVWDVYQDAGTLSGYYDDYEYQIVYDCGNVSPADVLRNVYLTVVRATK